MRREALYVLTIALGLFISAKYGQWPVDIWCISVFSFIYWKTDRKERIEMIAVLAFATPMELFFSEIWLIYEYQRGLMPLFVPVGHYFLFDLGRRVAERFQNAADASDTISCSIGHLGAEGTDTSAVLSFFDVGFVSGARTTPLCIDGLAYCLEL